MTLRADLKVGLYDYQLPTDCQADTLTFSLEESNNFGMIVEKKFEVPVKLTPRICQTPLLTKWVGVCACQFGDHAGAEGVVG